MVCWVAAQAAAVVTAGVARAAEVREAVVAAAEEARVVAAPQAAAAAEEEVMVAALAGLMVERMEVAVTAAMGAAAVATAAVGRTVQSRPQTACCDPPGWHSHRGTAPRTSPQRTRASERRTLAPIGSPAHPSG